MKIRWKLFLTLVLMVAGVSVASLLVAEYQFQSWVKSEVLSAFQRDVDLQLEARRQRLAEVRELASELSTHEVVTRLASTAGEQVTEQDRENMRRSYAVELRELREVERVRNGSMDELPLMGVVDRDGKRSFISRRRGKLAASLRDAGGAELMRLAKEGEQFVGYALLDGRTPGLSRVKELVATPLFEDGRWVGWFFLGRNAESREEQILAKYGPRDSWNGLWVDGEWFAPEADPALVSLIEKRIGEEFPNDKEPAVIEWQDEDYLLLGRVLNPDSPIGRGSQVAVFRLSRLQEALEGLRWGVMVLGGIAVVLSVIAAWSLALRFSGPIHRLVEGTERVRKGDLKTQVDVRSQDEFGMLASGFNRMVEELGLKEKYRDVLGKTSDPSVARRLMDGSLELGGEVRQAAVVFCDIRGFTEMTDGMAPADVIEMLNGHMTAMTQIIHKHGGVVDKFVGDLVMGVFGAPVSQDDDLQRAAACAVEMVSARARLNEGDGDPIDVGIGLASGRIMAGLMGSDDRLNYTVLGDRVNLAARLCSLAGSGEVLVDGQTAAALGDTFDKQGRGVMEVKGFRDPIEVLSLAIPGD